MKASSYEQLVKAQSDRIADLVCENSRLRQELADARNAYRFKDRAILSHDGVWRAIETLAVDYGMSVSGLAVKAGLNPTTFNLSKRIAPDGHRRWPSTETISKILDATGANIEMFVQLLPRTPNPPRKQRDDPYFSFQAAE